MSDDDESDIPFKSMNENPPILGIIALYAFGVATGFGIATLFYAYAF